MKIKFLLKNKITKYSILSLFAVLFCSFNANAQQITVKGVVTDSADNSPIPGVSVVVKGTQNGTSTDFDGNYTIKAEIGQTLVFAYLGMKNRNVKIQRPKHNVKMTSSTEELEEIVVIGYGAVKKKELTGSVAQVKADDIKQFVTPDIASAMQGQVAGVNITANSGEPGEQSNIQIRGITSLSGSNTPLFVVDGIPQEGDPRLASNEIETIDVLKDAASAAIYGTRGAAGVILITTKKGKEGKMAVSLDHSYGVQALGSGTPLMNSEEQLYFETARANYKQQLGISFFTPGPNRASWLSNDNVFSDLVLVDGAESESYNIRVSGGTKGFTYNVTGGYQNIDGVLIGSNFKRYNGRISTTYNTDNWNINSSIGFILEDRDRSPNQLITLATRYKPYFPLVDLTADQFISEEGNGGVTTPLNALAQAIKREDNQRNDKLNLSLSATRKITKDLDFTTRIGTNIDNVNRNIFRSKFELVDLETGIVESDPTFSGTSAFSSRLNVFSVDGFFTYKKKIGKHSINLLASMSADERTFESFTASRNGVLDNSIKVLNGSSQDPVADSGANYVRKNVGFLARAQYNYKGKYLVSAFVRRDGSSKFGSENRWGTFPSVSLAWNVSSEKFWKPLKGTINNFKVRLSRGTAGNDSFDDYQYAATITRELDYIFDTTDNNQTLGSAVTGFANPIIKWETSVSSNVGIDLGFLRNKFSFSADYYLTEKEDMLFPVRLPGSAGVIRNSGDQDQIRNIGDMTNKGLELALNYKGNIGDGRLNLGINFTKNQNEITKMSDGVDIIYNSNSNILGTPVTVFTLGREAGAFWLKPTDGVLSDHTPEKAAELLEYQTNVDSNAKAGDLKYIDKLTVDTDNDGIPDAGDGVIDNLDRDYAGSGLPDFEIGFNTNFSYKNFDFTMNWYASVGAEVINATKADAFARTRHKDLINMWTPQNPTSQIPFWIEREGRHPNYNGDSDLWVENGDYLRLKLVSLGYTIPKEVASKIGASKFRLFFSAQNPITITGYDGFDPEIGGNVTRRGIDSARFPLTSLYSLGFNLEF
ncbi:TonB-dependent receptor [Polaribacter sp. Z022]|uniref:SusC/RagA family TonB-linked outer membrane protein n=1 Tax=Polaribacter sp. Z022 TaxID=2927125 RepID=UPI002020D369|nr:TonB-dependent receptor [Polaribacter sp. Z022]MCL7754610.1 TonB-dependent receptor [Polaribacter sp. Z022]